MLFGLLKKRGKTEAASAGKSRPRRIITGTGPKNRPARIWPPDNALSKEKPPVNPPGGELPAKAENPNPGQPQ